VASKESILQIHLIPVVGGQKPDAISNAHVQRLKLHLRDKAAQTVNNVLTVLSVILKTAVEWELIPDRHARRAGVMPLQPPLDVGGEPNVVPIRVGFAAQDVHEAPLIVHARKRGRNRAGPKV
jgi:hypothetical protein